MTSESGIRPVLDQVNLVVRDIAASVAFYRLLGVAIGDPTDLHASLTFPSGMTFDLDQHEFAQQWSSGTPPLHAGSVVLCLAVPRRDDVDTLWRRAVDAGYRSSQRPYDAFWGSRFAVVADPDGYQIGLRSPSEEAHRYWPPRQAPTQ
jgi:uncharacterized glyoxalase superfamily protein PhnB